MGAVGDFVEFQGNINELMALSGRNFTVEVNDIAKGSVRLSPAGAVRALRALIVTGYSPDEALDDVRQQAVESATDTAVRHLVKGSERALALAGEKGPERALALAGEKEKLDGAGI